LNNRDRRSALPLPLRRDLDGTDRRGPS
jgi:hypothetical protein